jgi:hypothetical protein
MYLVIYLILNERKEMKNKPKAKNNKAKDVEVKRTPIPEPARTQIIQQQAALQTFISGAASALGVEKNWSLDLQRMEFVEKHEKD